MNQREGRKEKKWWMEQGEQEDTFKFLIIPVSFFYFSTCKDATNFWNFFDFHKRSNLFDC